MTEPNQTPETAPADVKQFNKAGFILRLTIMLNRLIIRRLNNIVGIANRVVEGDFESKIQPSSTDEIGQFEALFEQFRQVFVNLMKEHENLQNKK